MATGTAGSNARKHSNLGVMHEISATVAFGQTGQAVLVGTLPDGALVVKAIAFVTTAFNDSGTDLLDIGVNGEADRYASALDVSAVGEKTDTDLAGEVLALISGDTKVYATYTGQNANASAGSAVVYLTYLPRVG